MAAVWRRDPGRAVRRRLTACAAPTDTASASPGAISPASATAASRVPTATRVSGRGPGGGRASWDPAHPCLPQTSTTAWASRAAMGAHASTRWTPSAASAPAAGRASCATPVSGPRQAPPPSPGLCLCVLDWVCHTVPGGRPPVPEPVPGSCHLALLSRPSVFPDPAPVPPLPPQTLPECP